MSRTLVPQSGTGLLLSQEETVCLIKQYTEKLRNKIKNHKRYAEAAEKLPNNNADIEADIDENIGTEYAILQFDDTTDPDELVKKLTMEDCFDPDWLKNRILLQITEIPNQSDSQGNVYITRFWKEMNEILNREMYATETISDEMTTIIYTRKATTPQAFLSGNSYNSIDEIIHEFKTQIGDYLPEDFDYFKHLGYIESATYA